MRATDVTVTHEFKVALMKARQAKGLSQKDLAQKIMSKPSGMGWDGRMVRCMDAMRCCDAIDGCSCLCSVCALSVIAEYESGKAIPNPQIISQLNRTLGVTLPKIPKKKAVKDGEES